MSPFRILKAVSNTLFPRGRLNFHRKPPPSVRPSILKQKQLDERTNRMSPEELRKELERLYGPDGPELNDDGDLKTMIGGIAIMAAPVVWLALLCWAMARKEKQREAEKEQKSKDMNEMNRQLPRSQEDGKEQSEGAKKHGSEKGQARKETDGGSRNT